MQFRLTNENFSDKLKEEDQKAEKSLTRSRFFFFTSLMFHQRLVTKQTDLKNKSVNVNVRIMQHRCHVLVKLLANETEL